MDPEALVLLLNYLSCCVFTAGFHLKPVSISMVEVGIKDYLNPVVICQAHIPSQFLGSDGTGIPITSKCDVQVVLIKTDIDFSFISGRLTIKWLSLNKISHWICLHPYLFTDNSINNWRSVKSYGSHTLLRMGITQVKKENQDYRN